MHEDATIADMIQNRRYDQARGMALDRLRSSRMDAQAWVFLGQAMVGMKKGTMAGKSFERAWLLDPFANWIQKALYDVRHTPAGSQDPQVTRALDVPRVTVSACILTHNSARTIKASLTALDGAVDEIIVVDTGSEDETVKIAEELGATIYRYEWKDDFAAARNHAQSKARHNWIIHIDADEILFPDDRPNIRLAAGLLQATNTSVNILQVNRIGDQTSVQQAGRLYQRSTGQHWIYPVHEFLEPREGYRKARLHLRPMRIRVSHDGYDPSVSPVQENMERNVRIIAEALETAPQDPILHYYLGRNYLSLKEQDKAIASLEEADRLSGDNPDLAIIPDLRKILYTIYSRQGHGERALQEVEKLVSDRPDYPDGWYIRGAIYKNRGIVPEAERSLKRAIETRFTYRGSEPFDVAVDQKARQLLQEMGFQA